MLGRTTTGDEQERGGDRELFDADSSQKGKEVMTNRERLLAIMAGKSPDRIPWIPRLQSWYNAHVVQGTLPAEYEGLSLRQIERKLGMGTAARDARIFTVEQRGDIETERREEGNTTLTIYHTPAGVVSTRYRGSEELARVGIGALEIEHMIKGPEDFAAVEYMVQNQFYEPDYAAYRAYEAEIGEDGYPMTQVGDAPFHHYLQKLAGYQTAYYLPADYPEKVEHLIGLMEELERERLWPVVADSPARMILHGVHFDSSMTPPPHFSRYISPYYRDFSALLRERGKTLTTHADSDCRLILPHLKEAGFGMAETFTTYPQVSCTLEEARRAWGRQVIIWGGVPSVLLMEETYSEASFDDYMRQIFRTVAPGDAFILSVSDMVMPGTKVDRLKRIAEMVEAWGAYPVDPAHVI